MTNKPFSILIAAGGTGGHLFPGIAVADAIREQFPDARILFMATGKPFERRVLEEAGYPLATLKSSGMVGLGIFQKIKTVLKMPGAIMAAGLRIKQFQPHVVLGMGSYTAGPVVLAAKLMGVPTAIHEQNRIPGATNRILANRVSRVYLSFSDTEISTPEEKRRITGNPIRKTLCIPDEAPGKEKFTVLVLGGSQGAKAINTAIIDSLKALSAEDIELIHQTGQTDIERVQAAYAEKGVKAFVSPFINDMTGAYAQADLVVCRSGASTVAELTAIGKPALLIPFPFAAANHQVENAKAVENAGAGLMIEEKNLTPELLCESIINLKNHSESLSQMSTAALELGHADAATILATDIVSLSGYESHV